MDQSSPEEPQVFTINGQPFTPIPGVRYAHDYIKIKEDVDAGILPHGAYRTLCKTDLFFVAYFVVKNPLVNHPFCVQACQEVEQGPDGRTLDLWAREHCKTTIITVARTIQWILRNPEISVGIFSFSREIAKGFLGSIKAVLEGSDFLQFLFPEILYIDPDRESPRWSMEGGIIVKRKGFQKESTVEAWGLTDGMPTSKHFDLRIYDDIETDKVVNTPELIIKTIDAFDLSLNVGTMHGNHWVIGTHYHPEAILNKLRQRKAKDGSPLYQLRLKPATVDGSPDGEPVFLPPERLEELRATSPKHFFCQQLLDPTPRGERAFEPEWLIECGKESLPTNLKKFMIIDPAGERKDSKPGDAWGILVVGVDPVLDDKGFSWVYILDGLIEEMSSGDAINSVVAMYLRNGRILKLGVEKVAMSSAEVHVVNALRAKGRYLSEKNGNLQILRPAGREKKSRIRSALEVPFQHGKIKILDTVPYSVKARLATEMEKFPLWHDDGLDTLAYAYDMIKDYRFFGQSNDAPEPVKRREVYAGMFEDKEATPNGWMKH